MGNKNWEALDYNKKQVILCVFLIILNELNLVHVNIDTNSKDSHGYTLIRATYKNKTYKTKAHRVIGFFIWGDRIFNTDLVICHLNGNKEDFHPFNLYLGTCKDNSYHDIALDVNPNTSIKTKFLALARHNEQSLQSLNNQLSLYVALNSLIKIMI